MLNNKLWWQTLASLLSALESAAIDYTLSGASALLVQGVDIPQPQPLEIAIQWDLFTRAHALFQPEASIEHHSHWDSFSFMRSSLRVSLFCYYNTVVATDPDRLLITYNNRRIWVKALDYFVRDRAADDPLFSLAKAHFHTLQTHNNQLNEMAWNQDAYDAWVQRFGSPMDAGARIKKDPEARLATLYPYLEPLAGKKVMNLLGSHATKAIAMALLGAKVSVVDISRENARYAYETAQAAGASIRYLISDVLNLPGDELDMSYDLVLMELGILHYFVDLEPLTQIIARLLSPGGRLILQDFHPISTKLISSRGKKHKVTGNYFDKSLIVTDVAFSKHLPIDKQEDVRQVYLRRWTLGEVVTAVAQAGLFIHRLDEEPNSKIDDIGLPKTFTIVAEKRS